MTPENICWMRERPDTGYYTKDVDYPSGFIVDQMPMRLSYVAAISGFLPPDPIEEFSYCELGCSIGITLNTLAAANPNARFIGIDINQSSIAKAQCAADDAGLKNVEYIAQSFDNLASEKLPPFDYITMHGTYSWIPPETVKSVIRFLNKSLKPGGLFYVEFMLLPALAVAEPVARLMRELTAKLPCNSLSRADYALRKLISLCKHKAEFFVRNPQAVNTVAGWDKEREINPYWAENIAHAQLSGSWTPKYVTDVSDELGDAGLTRVGSTILALNDISLSLPREQVHTLADINDPLQIELMIDYLQNRRSRQDVFIKDATQKPIDARNFLLRRICLLPRASRAELDPSVTIPGCGKIQLKGPLYGGIIAMLDGKETKLSNLLETIIHTTSPYDDVFTVITHLIATGNYFLCIRPSVKIESIETSSTVTLPLAYNKYILYKQTEMLQPTTLACPATGGGGVSMPALEALLLRIWIESGLDGSISRALDVLKNQNTSIRIGNKLLAAKDITSTMLQEALLVLEHRRGLNLARLGAIEIRVIA